MMKPRNEMETVFKFAQMIPEGWEVLELGHLFPDAKILIDGEVYRAEFEFVSSHFVDHGHDITGCDIIICWEDNWGDNCPIPIIALGDPLWTSVDVTRGIDFEKAALFERSERIKLEKRVRSLKDSLESVSSEMANRGTDNEDTFRIRAAERREAIFQMLLDDTEISTKHLAEMYKVTDQTIRDDFRYLSKLGKISYANGKVGLVEEGDF